MAISPQTLENNAAVRENNRLEFPVLADAGNAYARQLGLVFALPGDLKELYLQFGIDLAASNGEPSWELPIPARLIVAPSGVIRSIDADPDYTRRPEPAATLDVLRGA